MTRTDRRRAVARAIEDAAPAAFGAWSKQRRHLARTGRMSLDLLMEEAERHGVAVEIGPEGVRDVEPNGVGQGTPAARDCRAPERGEEVTRGA